MNVSLIVFQRLTSPVGIPWTLANNVSLIKPVAIKTRCRVPVNVLLIVFQRLTSPVGIPWMLATNVSVTKTAPSSPSTVPSAEVSQGSSNLLIKRVLSSKDLSLPMLWLLLSKGQGRKVF